MLQSQHVFDGRGPAGLSFVIVQVDIPGIYRCVYKLVQCGTIGTREVSYRMIDAVFRIF
jgi:hypothetical protein